MVIVTREQSSRLERKSFVRAFHKRRDLVSSVLSFPSSLAPGDGKERTLGTRLQTSKILSSARFQKLSIVGVAKIRGSDCPVSVQVLMCVFSALLMSPLMSRNARN